MTYLAVGNYLSKIKETLPNYLKTSLTARYIYLPHNYYYLLSLN